MSATTTTAWAVGIGGDHCWTGEAWDEASSCALEELVDQVEHGDRLPGKYWLDVYEGAEWCTAETEDECACGCAWVHDEGRWGLIGWSRHYMLMAQIEIVDDVAELVEVEDLPAREVARG
jgi:hypothetical protein